jgi:hypothetical protein
MGIIDIASIITILASVSVVLYGIRMELKAKPLT